MPSDPRQNQANSVELPPNVPLDAGNIDLKPDTHESITREYAKKLALKQAYRDSLGYFESQNSEFGNLIVPVLRVSNRSAS